MIGKLFSAAEELKYNLTYCKIFDTKYNNMLCSKIQLRSEATGNYEIFKSLKQRNLLEILKISARSVYTRPILPFTQFIDRKKKQYNIHVVSKLKETVHFIHTSLKKEHNDICLESLFIDEMGDVILGNYGKISNFVDSKKDFSDVEAICSDLTGMNSEEIESPADSVFDAIFSTRAKPLSSETVESKKLLLSQILYFKSEVPEITKKYIFKIFIEDIKKDYEKEYKNFVLESLYELDDAYFKETRANLFSVVDSNVRMHLLNKFAQSSCNFDDICEDLSVGLRVKDKVLRHETINFIFDNTSQFSAQSMNFLILSMEICTDTETIQLICSRLLKYERQDTYKSIYKLLQVFLSLDKNIIDVYKNIEKYFMHFDKIKITKVILPNLCSKLIDKFNQDYYFILVEKIITFLKENRSEIQNTDWSFKNIKNIFSKQPETRENVDERLNTFYKKDASDWDDQDFF